MREDAERRVSLRRTGGHQGRDVGGVLAEHPEVEDGLQAGGRSVLTPGVAGWDSVPGAVIIANGALIGEHAFSQRRNVLIVVYHQVVVGVFMCQVELLGGSDYVDLE